MRQLTVAVFCVLWCVILGGFVLRQLPQEDKQIKVWEAFQELSPEQTQAQFDLCGSCPAVLTQEEQSNLLQKLALHLGIRSGYAVTETQKENGTCLTLSGSSADCSLTIQYFTISSHVIPEYYINLRLTLEEPDETVMEGQAFLEQLAKEYAIEGQVCLRLKGTIPGKQTAEQKKQIWQRLADTWKLTERETGGDESILIAYGYGEGMGNVVQNGDDSGNVNLILRDSSEGTRILLGFPVILNEE